MVYKRKKNLISEDKLGLTYKIKINSEMTLYVKSFSEIIIFTWNILTFFFFFFITFGCIRRESIVLKSGPVRWIDLRPGRSGVGIGPGWRKNREKNPDVTWLTRQDPVTNQLTFFYVFLLKRCRFNFFKKLTQSTRLKLGTQILNRAGSWNMRESNLPTPYNPRYSSILIMSVATVCGVQIWNLWKKYSVALSTRASSAFEVKAAPDVFPCWFLKMPYKSTR
jgi:hypothetical protein